MSSPGPAGIFERPERVSRLPRRAYSRIYDLRPRLAVLAALLDDWADRSLFDYLPELGLDDQDALLVPRRPSISLRRSYSTRKPDDSFDWMLDDDLDVFSDFCRRRSFSKKPRDVDELRAQRRQYFETNDTERSDPANKARQGDQRQVPVQVQRVPSDEKIHRETNIRIDVETDACHDRFPLANASARAPLPASDIGLPKELGRPVGRPDVRLRQDTFTEVPQVPMSALEEERRNVRDLQEENLRLKAVITNIQEVNKRWQTFNSDRQTYIQRLLATIDEQQKQINACLETLRDSRPYPESTPAASTATTPAPSPTTARAPTPEPAATPATRTSPLYSYTLGTQHNYESEARLRRLQREVAELQKRLNDAKRDHQETVTLLQMQVEAHKDDWEAERREKQAAVASKEEAENLLRNLAKKLQDDDKKSICSCEHGCSCSLNDLTTGTTATSTGSNGRATTPPPSDMSSQSGDGTEKRFFLLDDIVADGKGTMDQDMRRPEASPEKSQEAFPEEYSTPAVPDRDRSQYSFNTAALRSNQEPVYAHAGRGVSPCLSDALTPTPTPTPQQGYPIEVSGSASSLASGPAPNVSMPISSRGSTPDLDISICSDMTLDCSPPTPELEPTPIQGTLTVGFNSNGLANVTSFRMTPLSPLSPVPGSPVDGQSCRLHSVKSRMPSYWDQGAPTNTTEDVICPSCGKVFPPSKHVQFIDHFEECG